MGRQRLGIAVSTLVLATACTAPQRPLPNRQESAVCSDTSGLTSASDGKISAGPFAENLTSWTDKDGAKLWVRTSQDQEPTTAVIVAAPLDIVAGKAVSPVTQRRGVDQLAEPFDAPDGLFYPGSLQLPAAGQWRLTVTIGDDDGCSLFAAA